MWTHIRADETPDPSRGAWTGKRPSQRNPRDNGSAERSCRNGLLTITQQRTKTVMTNAHERLMQIAMEEARRGAVEGNAAVGSVVVRGENLIARGRNLVVTQSDPTAHAETVALRNAGAAMGHTDFSGFTLYTTFEPCPMCCGAILASGVSTLVLGARFADGSSQWGDYAVEMLLEMTGRGGRLRVVTGVLPEQCLDLRRLEAL